MTDTTISNRRDDQPSTFQWLAGRYRVDGLLGRGGMGEVYYGYDERLDRRVAIKVLRSPGSGPGGNLGVVPGSPEEAEILDAQRRDRTRFVREIRVTAGLELAGIPAVYDTGEEIAADGTSRIWVVMQLLRGQTLEALLFQEDFPPESVSAAGLTGNRRQPPPGHPSLARPAPCSSACRPYHLTCDTLGGLDGGRCTDLWVLASSWTDFTLIRAVE